MLLVLVYTIDARYGGEVHLVLPPGHPTVQGRRHASIAILPASVWRWRRCRGRGGLVQELTRRPVAFLPVRANIRQA